MSSESPPAKRQRTENAVTRSETWRSDGNVILQAGSIQFRVHWSVLGLHSSVFRDMQRLPQPPDQPSIDGCPIVELPDDATDVEYLLKALYIPTFHCQKKLPLAVVAAFIRLGRKYGFKDLFDSAVARLTFECPATLAEFDIAGTEFKTIEQYKSIMYDLVTLVSQHHILSALPCACYWLVKVRNITQLFDGMPNDHGTLTSLSLIDLRRCVVGHQRLLIKQFQPGYTLGWARKWEFDDDCTTLARCRASREIILSKFLDGTVIMALSSLQYTARSFDFCAACTQHATASVIAGRKKMWKELPGLFDLPPWSELKND